jgi:hypothetical protein
MESQLDGKNRHENPFFDLLERAGSTWLITMSGSRNTVFRERHFTIEDTSI